MEVHERLERLRRRAELEQRLLATQPSGLPKAAPQDQAREGTAEAPENTPGAPEFVHQDQPEQAFVRPDQQPSVPGAPGVAGAPGVPGVPGLAPFSPGYPAPQPLPRRYPRQDLQRPDLGRPEPGRSEPRWPDLAPPEPDEAAYGPAGYAPVEHGPVEHGPVEHGPQVFAAPPAALPDLGPEFEPEPVRPYVIEPEPHTPQAIEAEPMTAYPVEAEPAAPYALVPEPPTGASAVQQEPDTAELRAVVAADPQGGGAGAALGDPDIADELPDLDATDLDATDADVTDLGVGDTDVTALDVADTDVADTDVTVLAGLADQPAQDRSGSPLPVADPVASELIDSGPSAPDLSDVVFDELDSGTPTGPGSETGAERYAGTDLLPGTEVEPAPAAPAPDAPPPQEPLASMIYDVLAALQPVLQRYPGLVVGVWPPGAPVRDAQAAARLTLDAGNGLTLQMPDRLSRPRPLPEPEPEPPMHSPVQWESSPEPSPEPEGDEHGLHRSVAAELASLLRDGIAGR